MLGDSCDMADLADRGLAHDRLVDLAGKAAVMRCALEHFNASDADMTRTFMRGLQRLLAEIEADAWEVARVQFNEEWEARFGDVSRDR